MRLLRNNVEREAFGMQAEKLINQGFKTLEKTEPKGMTDAKDDDMSKMNVKELKALAKEKGIDGAASLNKEELLSVLKEVV